MKKVFYSTILASAIIGGTVLFSSCQKEDKNLNNKFDDSNGTTATIIQDLSGSLNPFNDSGQIYYNNLKIVIQDVANLVFSTPNPDSILFSNLMSSSF